MRRITIGLMTVSTTWVTLARADMIVSLVPRDSDMNEVTGPVPAGTLLTVDILLSTDGADDPLPDLQSLQFDFAATTAGIEFGRFTWLLDASAYGLRVAALPTPSAFAVVFTERPRLLNLSADPQLVATVDIAVLANGTLNALGGTGIAETTRAQFGVGLPIPTNFSLVAGNLRGGRLDFEVGEPVTPGMDDGAGDSMTPDSPDSNANPTTPGNSEAGATDGEGTDAQTPATTEPQDGSSTPNNDTTTPPTSGTTTDALPLVGPAPCGMALVGFGFAVVALTAVKIRRWGGSQTPMNRG